ncbi:MAG: septal ring lytic transglycosylase RlpA family protein [Gammaproteobacteria bacterium]|nr:MAG: septal ring lytic transglycosylase RlpA family protein [Gammaproteobacteria bacterium]
MRAWVWGLAAVLLAGCSTSRYHVDQDYGPRSPVTITAEEPTPRFEPRSRSGNKSPYTVNGRTYHVLASAQGYVEEGVASWYGNKFHGHRTSNGEIYDMYKYTAAHKTLPLPSYVRVTNLANGRSVVVRVNDRGPFHGNRLIDLSYAAAQKLGYVGQGTARVRVEAIQPGNYQAALDRQGYYIQVAAVSEQARAIRLTNEVANLIDQNVFYEYGEQAGVYRVRVGPFAQERDARHYEALLARTGRFDTIVIQRPWR